MIPRSSSLVTPDRTLRLEELSDAEFEQLLLLFFDTHPTLTISRNGETVVRRVSDATTYAREGRNQKGIDLRLEVEGGEVWAIQAKRVRQWTEGKTKIAIDDAKAFGASHNFLLLACNPPASVHDEIARHSHWTLWNRDRTCAEIRLRTPPDQLAKVLSPLLSPDELLRFAPFATSALISASDFFAARLGRDHIFRHDWELIGREPELAALAAFLADSEAQGFILWSKGGEGKSRLLLEFARRTESTTPDIPVLFLNPGSREPLEFALLQPGKNFAVVVDDAHRLDPRHRQLVQLAAQDERIKLVFATRPQGFEPLLREIHSAGLRERCRDHALTPLRKPEVRKLAAQALGPQRKTRARDLTELTGDSPFLTVLAGDLLARGQLQWSQWTSHAELQRLVFAAFEEENFRDTDPDQRKIDARILRVIALVAPVVSDAKFFDSIGHCLGIPAIDAEDRIRSLTTIGLLGADEAALRITPDLFADFLAYHTCFDPSGRNLSLVRRVRETFPASNSAILRNVAETAWIAVGDGRDAKSFFEPLVEEEFRRFERSSFPDRARQIDHWDRFGVFLPEQTIALADLALRLDEAPPPEPETPRFLPFPEEFDTHQHVLGKLPGLLHPIALYHSTHRQAALGRLWEVSARSPTKHTLHTEAPGWSAIAEVIKLQADKSVDVTHEALRWLKQKLGEEGNLAIIEDHRRALALMLGGAFARFVEFREQKGTSFSYWEQPVDLPATQTIRADARAILRQIIEHGSWKAALAALDVAQTAIRRIPKSQQWITDADAFRRRWRSERLAALDLFRTAIERHPEPALRYSVHLFLRRVASFEEDSKFQAACSALAASIPDDPALRFTRALLSEGTFESDDEDGLPPTKESRQACRENWAAIRDQFFEEFLTSHPAPDDLLTAFRLTDEHLREGGFHPLPGHFFGHIASRHPGLAHNLASRIIETLPDHPLTRFWPCLLPPATPQDATALALQTAAALRPDSAASCAAIGSLIGQRDPASPPTEGQRDLVFEIAARAGLSEISTFLRLIEIDRPADLDLRWEIVSRLPFERYPDEALPLVLDTLPQLCADPAPPGECIRALLAKFLHARQFELDLRPEAGELLSRVHAFETLRFLRARLELEISSTAPEGFRALPFMDEIHLDVSSMKQHPEFETLREDIWHHSTSGDSHSRVWRRLFACFGTDDATWLLPRLEQKIDAAADIETLRSLTKLIKFDGSLFVFRNPHLTRRFLTRAEQVGDQDGRLDLRSALYLATGPQSWGWTNGKRDPESDYVQAEAIKSATTHSEDQVLYPFYCWIAECEQAQKDRLLSEHEIDMQNLE